jgi:hypothetical protein
MQEQLHNLCQAIEVSGVGSANATGMSRQTYNCDVASEAQNHRENDRQENQPNLAMQ